MSLPKRPRHPYGELVDGVTTQNHPLYATWSLMLRRCYCDAVADYPRYGGRGITVCRSWWQFKNFVQDMGQKPSPKHSIERVKNDQGYKKSNCVWATKTEQCLNRRMFKNNKTGATGVKLLRNGTYDTYFHFEGERFRIGVFADVKIAETARKDFVKLFKKDPDAARQRACAEKVAVKSSTGIHGVTPLDDGFVARATIDGERTYIGYFKTVSEAENARLEFIASRNRKPQKRG